MPSDVPVRIGYAPTPSARRRWARRLLPAGVLLLVVAAGYAWGPGLWHRAQLAHWYGRSADHAAPEGAVVWQGQLEPKFVRIGTPYVPQAWRTFYAKLSPPGFQTDGTAFLHARQTPGGRTVLVAVDVIRPAAGPASFFVGGDPNLPQFHVRAFNRKSLLGRPSQIQDDRVAVGLPYCADLRILTGIPNPADPTHFTIPYEADGRPGTIEGWVREDRVELQLAPPATPLPPVSPG